MGTALFKAPALKLAEMNTRVSPLETFLYTFDHKGEHSRWKLGFFEWFYFPALIHDAKFTWITSKCFVKYRFGYGEDTSHYPFDGGVHHSDDLIYLFPYPPDVAKLNEEDTKVAQIMVDLWTSFAINGVPNLPRFKGEDGNNDNATWPPYLGNFDVEFQFICFLNILVHWLSKSSILQQNDKSNFYSISWNCRPN